MAEDQCPPPPKYNDQSFNCFYSLNSAVNGDFLVEKYEKRCCRRQMGTILRLGDTREEFVYYKMIMLLINFASRLF
jgi:hypothetical protein